MDIVRQNELTPELNDPKHPVQKARQKYEKLLLSHGFMDYTMIVLEAVKALHSRKDIQKKVGNRVKHVIVDEYQDVNPLQECLIKLLHDLGARICVVGDDDQTIYQWNGSDIKNILSFTDRYPKVETITMGKNFRSSEAIVTTAREVAERNGERLSKIMESASCQVFERGDLVCRELGSPVAEAEWMAVNIAKMRGLTFRDTPGGDERGLDWSDFAILLRSTNSNLFSR